jgi:mannan endo-1,4-beta-mannosidase
MVDGAPRFPREQPGGADRRRRLGRTLYRGLPAALLLGMSLHSVWSVGSPHRGVDPASTLEVEHVLGSLYSARGQVALSGQQQYSDSPRYLSSMDTYVRSHTVGGLASAIRGWDVPFGGARSGDADPLISTIIDDYVARGVLPEVSQHWTPVGDQGNASIGATVDISGLLSGPGPDALRYRAWRSHLADDLLRLQAAGVPVLFRPFHEAGGTWFWWNKQGPLGYQRLWQDLFTYLTQTRQVHNLVWIWSASSTDPDRDWVPFVGADIFAQDRYGNASANYGTEADYLRGLAGGKLIAMSELDYLPDERFAGLGFSYFLAWMRPYLDVNRPDVLSRTYGCACVATARDSARWADPGPVRRWRATVGQMFSRVLAP